MHRKNMSQTWWLAATNDLELWTGALGHKMWPGLKSNPEKQIGDLGHGNHIQLLNVP